MPAGIYLHIPFCRARCSYCDFAVSIYQADLAENYVAAICAEIEQSKNHNPLSDIDTIYFGGGTPSLLTAKQVERILAAVFDKFSIAANAEITLELNPATMDLETLREFRGLGVNRASFGVQTFNDAELKRLGRTHSAEDVRETIELLRAADFHDVSFDLIAGLPRQTLADWERNLDTALALKPEHLSLYLLEINEGTPLAKHIAEGKEAMPDEDLAAEMYEMLLAKIAGSDYRQYEIANFARAGFESKHNSKYWTLDAVYGFGCSVHSFDGEQTRWSNERDTRQYLKLIAAGESPIVETTPIDAAAEFAFLGLRMTRGINLDDYRNRFDIDLLEKYGADLEIFFETKMLEIAAGNLRLTGKGVLFSNEIFEVFV